MKITIKNIIKENIDPKEKYINKLSSILKPPYFYNLIVTETPKYLWDRILSKIFNQEVEVNLYYLSDSNDNVIYSEDSDGYWYKQEYDSNNNLIYHENSDGFWEKYEYESNGNEIYHEDSTGYWEKKEYNSKGNLIYYENSDGYWRKQEYDSNGNRIYLENSDGYWRKQEYNDVGKLIYYENSDGEIIDNRPNNPINENIDPKQKYVNGIVNIIKPPYYNFLKVNEVPEKLWNDIFSKLFKQKVKYSYMFDGIFFIHDSNNKQIYREEFGGFVEDEDIDLGLDEFGNPIIDFDEFGNPIIDVYWEKWEYDSNNNLIYYEKSGGYWEKREFDSRRNVIYYEDSDGVIRDNRPSNPINEDIDPKQRFVNGILNMIRRPYMGFLINNEVPEELWKDILTKIFNTNDIDWGINPNPNPNPDPDFEVRYELIILDEKGKQLYYETHDYWEQLIYGYHTRLDMDFTWYINSVGSKKVTFVGKHNPVVYSNGPTGYSWSGLSDDIKNNKFFDLNY